jgi:hypothetical protein
MIRLKKKLAIFVSAAITITSLLTNTSIMVKAEGQSKDSKDIWINGNWEQQYQTLINTQEAEFMVRVGDIDNFGYGWGNNPNSPNKDYFDPFTGTETLTHPFPFKPSDKDPNGTDRIMVVSGYNGNANNDGYTSNTWGKYGYYTDVSPVELRYSLNGKKVNNVLIQMFVDDIQPNKWVNINGTWVNRGRTGGFSPLSYNQYTVTFSIPSGSGRTTVEIPEFSQMINNLDQHGPIGKMISFNVPQQYLYLFQNGGNGLQIKIDDTRNYVKNIYGNTIRNTGDGYAIDFVKLLINRKSGFTEYDATVKGGVYEAKYEGDTLVLDKSKPISGVSISLSGVSGTITSNGSGQYYCNNVPAGQVILAAEKSGYTKAVYTIPTLEAKQVLTQDIGLINLSPPDMPLISLSTTEITNQDVIATITYNGDYAHKYYRINGGSWLNYTGPVTITENCKLEAQAKDEIRTSGSTSQEVVSPIAEETITNIDKNPPDGRIDVTRNAKEAYMDFTPLEAGVTMLPPPSTYSYDGKTFIVDGDKIKLNNNVVAVISSDRKRVTCYINFKYTFYFSDAVGNAASKEGAATLGWDLPMQDR